MNGFRQNDEFHGFRFTINDENLEQAKIAMLESVTLLQEKIARLSLPS